MDDTKTEPAEAAEAVWSSLVERLVDLFHEQDIPATEVANATDLDYTRTWRVLTNRVQPPRGFVMLQRLGAYYGLELSWKKLDAATSMASLSKITTDFQGIDHQT